MSTVIETLNFNYKTVGRE